MEIIIPIIAAVVVISLLSKLNKKADDEERLNREFDAVASSAEEPVAESADESADVKSDTLGLMFNALTNLGCQPEKNPDGTLSVAYQGENFHVEFGGRLVRVWDPMWANVKVDDPDLPKVRDAINKANFGFGPAVVLTDADDEGLMGFCTRRDIMLHPACPDNDIYIKSVLDSFFKVKEDVRQNYLALDAGQKESAKKRRPAGFTAGDAEA